MEHTGEKEGVKKKSKRGVRESCVDEKRVRECCESDGHLLRDLASDTAHSQL